MTRTEDGDTRVEKFAPNGGSVVAVVGGVVSVGFIVVWVFDMDGVPLWVPAVSLLGGIVLYTSTVRPRVWVVGRELVLRNMLSTIYIPLAAIEEVVIQQVLAVRAGGKRYVCAGVGRTLRQAMKGSAVQQAREQMGGFRGELAAAEMKEPAMNYADFVEIRIQELVNEDRMRLGVKRLSPEADELARQIRREPAWPEIAGLVAATAFLLVAVFAS